MGVCFKVRDPLPRCGLQPQSTADQVTWYEYSTVWGSGDDAAVGDRG